MKICLISKKLLFFTHKHEHKITKLIINKITEITFKKILLLSLRFLFIVTLIVFFVNKSK